MNCQLNSIRSGLATLLFLTSATIGMGQKNADQWLRVTTGEGSTIDVDRTSLVLQENRIISADFKTALVKPEPVSKNADPKYQARIDSIQFDLKNFSYRIAETTFIDASGKVLSSRSSNAGDGWKNIRGGTGNMLLRAAGQLSPFGVWKVLSYRYADGTPPSNEDPPELRSLPGSDVFFNYERANAGGKSCYSVVFEPRKITGDEFVKRFGNPLQSIGITTDKVDSIVIKCEGHDQFPQQSIVFLLPNQKAIMFWDGVFLEIDRGKNLFSL